MEGEVFMMKLRPHQERIVNKMSTTPKGQVIVPTGGGKTMCMIKDAQREFNSCSWDVFVKRPERKTVVVVSPREAQRKAAMERRAAKSGAKTPTADELLAKKAKKKVDPNYKPRKASGLTHRERLNLVKKGEKKLRDLVLKSTGKEKESELKHPITQKEITRRRKKAQA